MKIAGVLLAAVFVMSACGRRQYAVKNVEAVRVEMDGAWEPLAATPMRALVDSLRAETAGEISAVIGTAERTLTKGKPQSLLGNFVADAVFDYAAGLWGAVDFAVVNLGGIRSSLHRGEITVGNMYEVFPFDNRIVLIELPGRAVEEFFAVVAEKEGEGLSKNIAFVIKDKSVRSLKIGGQPVDGNKNYRIATINYLAEGNDGMEVFTKAVKVMDSGVFVRDALIEHVKRLTAGNNAVDAGLDDRVVVL